LEFSNLLHGTRGASVSAELCVSLVLLPSSEIPTQRIGDGTGLLTHTALFENRSLTGSSPFTQVAEGKEGLLAGNLWALIAGSILALLLLGCLVVFLIFRKRNASELPEDSHGEEELDETVEEATWAGEDHDLGSEYGLTNSGGSDSEWSAARPLDSKKRPAGNTGSRLALDDELGDDAELGSCTDDHLDDELGNGDDFANVSAAAPIGSLDYTDRPAGSADLGRSAEYAPMHE
jgi:hypothetical protein